MPSNQVLPQPYAKSIARSKIQARLEAGTPVRLAMLDIDSTLTGNPKAALRCREMLERRGDVIVFNTSRTEEMVMTQASYVASRAGGRFSRPAPRLGHEGSRRIVVPQECAEPPALLDPDIIAGSTGTRILVRQNDRFLPDDSFPDPETPPPHDWRRQVLALIDRINDDRIAAPAPIEDEGNYAAGITDVYPPDYRVQLNFAAPGNRIEAIHRLRIIAHEGDQPLASVARSLRILDDSEPREGRYKAFVVPRWASKARAACHILHSLRLGSGLASLKPEVLFVGDSAPDLHMALVGGAGANATLLLVGGSRLSAVLTDPADGEFAGESLRAIKRRLSRTDRPGRLLYALPGTADRVHILIGDIAFPGTIGPETVRQYLESTAESSEAQAT